VVFFKDDHELPPAGPLTPEALAAEALKLIGYRRAAPALIMNGQRSFHLVKASSS
jgi:hypothetical protein